MHAFQTFGVIYTLAVTAAAFQPSMRHHLSRSLFLRQSSTTSAIQQTENIVQDEDDEYELLDFFVSPEQINTLRKEAKKRQSRRKLTTFFIPPEEVSQDTINAISALFDTNELIELRSVSRDKKKQVFDTAYALAATLENEVEKPVVVVDIKGYAVKLYCPFTDDEQGKRIQLRTSYKPGQWSKKPKAIRDDRGQIITDENGKSIKEIPEY